MTKRLHLVTPGMPGAPDDYLVSLSVRVCAPSSHEAAELVKNVFVASEFAKGVPRMWFADITVDQLVERDRQRLGRHELSDNMAMLFELFLTELEDSDPAEAPTDCDDYPDDP